MRYKILLMGGNNSLIDDFFFHMDDVFEVQTTSLRYEDLLSHIKYFDPDILGFCMDEELKDNMTRLVAVLNHVKNNKIRLVIMGSTEECLVFSKTTAHIHDLQIEKPLSVSKVKDKIIGYMREKEAEKEEIEAKIRAKEEKKKEQNDEVLDILDALESGALEKAPVKKHILVVDDDPGMLKTIKEHLHEQYDVATAINGKVAKKFLEKKSTDLILLDYLMPEQDGPAVLRELHENPKTKDIPVVFLTGMTEKNKIREALVEKPQGYLVKPVDHNKLMATVTSILK